MSANDSLMVGLLSRHAKMSAEYKHTFGGSAPLDTYIGRLRLFFHHTSNAHVCGLVGCGVDETGLTLHANRGAAQAACKDAAGTGDEEFNHGCSRNKPLSLFAYPERSLSPDSPPRGGRPPLEAVNLHTPDPQ